MPRETNDDAEFNEPGPELAADSMYDAPVDAAAIRALIKRNSAPGGSYRTDPDVDPWEHAPFDTEDGRPMFRLSGRATVKTRTDGDVSLNLSYLVSPEDRPARDGEGQEIPGKSDLATRLFLGAFAVYENDCGDAPKTVGAILDHLSTMPVILRCMPGSRPLVLEILPVKRWRQR